MKNLLITCGLPYSNGMLHVGHIAGCYLPADIYVRYQRSKSRQVLFICGSDDHGVPIKLTADKENKSPAEIATYYNQRQQKDFQELGISFDIYGATSNSEFHTQTSQDFFKTLYDKGYFEKKSSKQFYDSAENMFLPDRYVKGTCTYCNAKDQNSDQCEECGKELDAEHLKDPYSIISKKSASLEETYHWYLDLTRFEKAVTTWLDNATTREHTKKFVSGLISSGLVKRSMTRDLDWGIPLPIDDPDALNKVLYVWFDAPIGYISNTKSICKKTHDNYENWWKSEDTEIYHFIGEDNTVFHCVIWIAMLSAEGSFQLPKGVIVNNFVNIKKRGEEADKISKSRGNAVWINEYLAEGGNPDSLRYYLNSIAPEKSRSVFNEDDLIQKHNSELGNALGNFVNRVLSFYKKNFGSELALLNQSLLNESDQKFLVSREELPKQLAELIENFQFKSAQEKLFEFIRGCNLYMDEKAPWKQIKEDRNQAQNTLLICINAIYTIAITAQPFLPFTAEKILEMLGSPKDFSWQNAVKKVSPEQVLDEVKILFEKLEA